jgi:hypothetical protein
LEQRNRAPASELRSWDGSGNIGPTEVGILMGRPKKAKQFRPWRSQLLSVLSSPRPILSITEEIAA